MKKLIIVVAVALAASFGYGAAAGWGTDWIYADITGYSNYDDGSANGSYWIVALTSASTDGISVDKDGNITLGSGMTQLANGSIADISQGASGIITGISANQYVALVVYDSDAVAGDFVGAYGIAVGQVSADAADDPPTQGTVYSNGGTAFDSDGSGYVAANIGIVGEAVPEPTSGLLLLLGGAMLALRRRRA